MRSAMHVIRGHAELLSSGAATEDVEARASAAFIMDACGRLGGLCEDVVDFLRLPGVTGDLVDLRLGDLLHAHAVLAGERGTRLRIVAPKPDGRRVLVQSTVRRTVMHVLEHVVRGGESRVTLTGTLRDGEESCVIDVTPVPSGVSEAEDGIVAIARELVAVHGGSLAVASAQMRLVFPIRYGAS
jgi:hypothetical protein